MSARKISHSDLLPDSKPAAPARLHLPATAVTLRKNGIEFRTDTPLTPWAEIDLTLETPSSTRRLHCNGVVVSCEGNRALGFKVVVLFTALSRQAQSQLHSLMYSGLS